MSDVIIIRKRWPNLSKVLGSVGMAISIYTYAQYPHALAISLITTFSLSIFSDINVAVRKKKESDNVEIGYELFGRFWISSSVKANAVVCIDIQQAADRFYEVGLLATTEFIRLDRRPNRIKAEEIKSDLESKISANWT